MTVIPTNLAYLIIRDGTKWSDIFRLIPGRTVTLGRGTTNQIVIKDERASRQHAEIFASERGWMLRDLASRNGTRIDESLIEGDVILTPGDIIRIAQYELSFVDNLEQGLARKRDDLPHNQSDDLAEAITDDSSESHVWDEGPEIETDESPVITHRRDRTRFLSSSDEEAPNFGMSEAATKLCRIAFELAQQMNSLAVAQRALEGLFEGTQIDGGGVWFLQPTAKTPGRFTDLELAAMRSEDRPRYHKVTEFLANTVLKDGEAVLARNIFEDSALGSRDSKGMIYSQSVICAPIRHADHILGLIHTYATKDDHQPTVEDLEFTLAVADNVALAVSNLNRQRALTDSLSQTKSDWGSKASW